MSAADPNRRGPQAGGALIAIGAVGGAAAGLVAHEPTIGLLIGMVAGVGLSLAIWLLDRN